MVFPVVMYGCESWTVKKAESRRIDAFELWCWRRLSRVPWTVRRSNQSIIKEISPGCTQVVEAETPILWPPDAKSWFVWKDPDAGNDWGWEEKGTTEDETVGWNHWLSGDEFELSSRCWWWDREVWCAVVHGVAKSWTWLSDWTELKWTIFFSSDFSKDGFVIFWFPVLLLESPRSFLIFFFLVFSTPFQIFANNGISKALIFKI